MLAILITGLLVAAGLIKHALEERARHASPGVPPYAETEAEAKRLADERLLRFMVEENKRTRAQEAIDDRESVSESDRQRRRERLEALSAQRTREEYLRLLREARKELQEKAKPPPSRRPACSPP